MLTFRNVVPLKSSLPWLPGLRSELEKAQVFSHQAIYWPRWQRFHYSYKKKKQKTTGSQWFNMTELISCSHRMSGADQLSLLSLRGPGFRYIHEHCVRRRTHGKLHTSPCRLCSRFIDQSKSHSQPELQQVGWGHSRCAHEKGAGAKGHDDHHVLRLPCLNPGEERPFD